MVRLSKMTDYALVILTSMARSESRTIRTARDLAEETRLPLPTVAKLLKALSYSRLLVSYRGTRGGYGLARDPESITLAEVIRALEGPIALTECSADGSGLCQLEPCCVIKQNQQAISKAVQGVLENLTIADLARPLTLTAVRDGRGLLVPRISENQGRTQ
jgi:FeS assembly SUF system regulator